MCGEGGAAGWRRVKPTPIHSHLFFNVCIVSRLAGSMRCSSALQMTEWELPDKCNLSCSSLQDVQLIPTVGPPCNVCQLLSHGKCEAHNFSMLMWTQMNNCLCYLFKLCFASLFYFLIFYFHFNIVYCIWHSALVQTASINCIKLLLLSQMYEQCTSLQNPWQELKIWQIQYVFAKQVADIHIKHGPWLSFVSEL